MTNLPHDPYMDLVHACLSDHGASPSMWTSTPDNETLEGVFEFNEADINTTQWPDGVFLSWDQNEGWALTERGTDRTRYSLELNLYANPRQVAGRVMQQLRVRSIAPLDALHWHEGAVVAAVADWEAEA